MNLDWDKVKTTFAPVPLLQSEEQFLYLPLQETFATEEKGLRTLFARLGRHPVWATEPDYDWRYLDNGDPVTEVILKSWFPHHEELEVLDPRTGQAYYNEKEVKYNNETESWTYHNNRPVNFTVSKEASTQESSKESEESDDDTSQVDRLLQSTTALLRKVVSRPASPALPTSTLPRVPAPATTSTSQVPTPPVSKGKGKAPAVPLWTSASSPAPNPTSAGPPAAPSTPKPKASQPIQAPVPTSGPVPIQTPAAPPPGPPNPPAPAVPMAAPHPLPRPTGTSPEPYDGKYEGAIAFWNALENYYTMNDASFPNVGAKIASALTHFKLGTPAGEWASDQIATALGQTPVNYGTWAAFKAAYNQQFIPPESQAEAISKMHNTFQRDLDFGKWYQLWSQYARRAGVDDTTKQYAFRRCLNPSLQQKLLNVTPAPATLDAMVQKARDFDHNWRIYAGPARQGRGTRVQEIKTEDAQINARINASQPTRGRTPSKKRGRLPQEERKRRMDNNLCLYCGKEGHVIKDCKAAPK